MIEAIGRRCHLSAAYVVNAFLLILLAVVTCYPFWYVCMMTFSTNLDAQNVVWLLWPRGFTLENSVKTSSTTKNKDLSERMQCKQAHKGGLNCEGASQPTQRGKRNPPVRPPAKPEA